MLRGFHKICDKGLWDEARKLFRDKSENAKVTKDTASHPGGYGEWTALHIACKRDPPADVVKTLCTMSHIPAETFDLYNKLPIHYAAEYGASFDVMKALIECCPQCLSGVDNEGRTPLHLSFKYSIQDPATLVDPIRGFPSREEVELLLGDDSSVLWTADESDYIPLHYAVSNIDNCSMKVLEMLITADVNSVVAQTKAGMTPLQLAIQKSTERKITVPLVKLLLGISLDGKECIDEEFEVTRMLSSEDMLPLHFACQNHENVPMETLELLLERCPNAAAAEALERGCPLQLLEANRKNIKEKKEIKIFNQKSDFIFAYNPNIIPYRTEMDRLKRFEEKIVSELSRRNSSLSEETKAVWIWMCKFPEEDDKEVLYPALIEGILESISDVGSAKMLACIQTTTKDGEEIPLHRAVSPTTAEVLSPYLRFVDRYDIKTDEINESTSSMVLKAQDCTFPEGDDRRNVVINFYSKRDVFSHEVEMNRNLQKTAEMEGLSSPTITIIQTFDMDRMGTSLETKDDAAFARDMTQFDGMYANLSGFSYAIVHEETEGDIDSIVSFNDLEKNYRIENKKQLQDIAESIQCLHNNNYLLGDMQARDFVQAHGSIKLRSVESIVQVGSTTKQNSKLYGCVSQDFGFSNLPPEMIAKLDTAGVEKYLMYWNREFNDFHIGNEHTSESVRQSGKVKAFLEKEGCSFEEFWSRIQRNAAIWKRIQPRQVGDHYYVAKCYRSGKNGGVEAPDQLPYELVPFSKSLDIWYFGSLIFELITEESLMHSNKTRNMVNDSDVERLFSWSMAHYPVSRRLNDIADPLARDLLRSLLNTASHRQQNMETILQHPFFCNTKDDVVAEVSKEIIQEEKESAKNFKAEQYLTLKKSTLDKRTENIPLVSLETQQKFELSQWKTLKSVYDLSEVTFPTSCVILPYELEKDFSGVFRVPKKSNTLSCKLGLVIADVLHYLCLVSDFKETWAGESYDYKVQEYMEMNRTAKSSPEDNLIRICEGVIRKAHNASAIVSGIANSYVTYGDASSIADKLVSDTLRDIVDLDVCGKVVSGAEATQNSISVLLGSVGEYPEKTAENMMNEQLRDVIGVDFTESSFAKKETVQNELLSLVQRFTENPLLVMQRLLESRICELIDIYTQMGVCHVYLVDEYSGCPVVSGLYPCKMEFSLNVAKTLIPPMILTMRSNFPLGILPLLGLALDEVPPQWAKLSHFQLPSKRSNPVDEIETLQGVLGVSQDFGILPLIERFFMKKDPEEDFAGLIRLSSPNGLIMWTTEESREEALKETRQVMIEFQDNKCKAALEKIASVSENKTTANKDNLWRVKEVFSPQSHLEVRQPPTSNVPMVNNNANRRWQEAEKNSTIDKIQNKLDKLKSWKSEKRTEPAPPTPQRSNTSDEYRSKATDEQEVQERQQLLVRSDEPNHRIIVAFDPQKQEELIDENVTMDEDDEELDQHENSNDIILRDAEENNEEIEETPENEDNGRSERGNIHITPSRSMGPDTVDRSPGESDTSVEKDDRHEKPSEEPRQQPTPTARVFRRLESREPAEDHVSVAESAAGSRMSALSPSVSRINRLRPKTPKTVQMAPSKDENSRIFRGSSYGSKDSRKQIQFSRRLSPSFEGDNSNVYHRTPRRLRTEVSE